MLYHAIAAEALSRSQDDTNRKGRRRPVPILNTSIHVEKEGKEKEEGEDWVPDVGRLVARVERMK
jgi:hypothetical protein